MTLRSETLVRSCSKWESYTFNHFEKFVMALTPCSHCIKANWFKICENQCFIARHSTAETFLLGDYMTWYKCFPNILTVH